MSVRSDRERWRQKSIQKIQQSHKGSQRRCRARRRRRRRKGGVDSRRSKSRRWRQILDLADTCKGMSNQTIMASIDRWPRRKKASVDSPRGKLELRWRRCRTRSSYFRRESKWVVKKNQREWKWSLNIDTLKSKRIKILIPFHNWTKHMISKNPIPFHSFHILNSIPFYSLISEPNRPEL